MDWQAWITPVVVVAAYWSLRREIGSLRDRVDRLAEDVAFLKGVWSRSEPPKPPA